MARFSAFKDAQVKYIAPSTQSIYVLVSYMFFLLLLSMQNEIFQLNQSWTKKLITIKTTA